MRVSELAKLGEAGVDNRIKAAKIEAGLRKHAGTMDTVFEGIQSMLPSNTRVEDSMFDPRVNGENHPASNFSLAVEFGGGRKLHDKNIEPSSFRHNYKAPVLEFVLEPDSSTKPPLAVYHEGSEDNLALAVRMVLPKYPGMGTDVVRTETPEPAPMFTPEKVTAALDAGLTINNDTHHMAVSMRISSSEDPKEVQRRLTMFMSTVSPVLRDSALQGTLQKEPVSAK